MRFACLISLAALSGIACSGPDRPVASEAQMHEIALPSGERLRVPEHPVRILPMSSSAVDYVLALVPRDRVVAVPEAAANYACSLQTGEPWPTTRMVMKFSAEAMLARNPDLVIAHAWQTPAEALEVVAASGIPVLRLGDSNELQDILNALETVALAVGEVSSGDQLVLALERRATTLRESSSERAALSALAYTNFGSGGWTAGSGTTADIVIELTGMQNASAQDERVGHYELDIERLLVLDPDVVLLSESTNQYSASRAYLENESALGSLKALQDGWIITLPAALFSTNSHHLLDTAERLASEVDALLERGR